MLEFKRYLGVISVFILIMVGLSMFTSYAYYSFTNATTAFNTDTTSDLIDIDYSSGKYINISDGVPVVCDDINDSSDVGRNNFSINVKGNSNKRDIVVSIKLVDIAMDHELKDESFKYELLYNNRVVSEGNFKDCDGNELEISDSIILNGKRNNDFELRLYILDNNESQNDLMNKTFRGSISVDVVSRNDSASDFKVSSIMVDGKKSEIIPVSGNYKVTSKKCGNVISWDNNTRSLTVKASSNGFIKNCDLEFTSTEEGKVLLSSVAKSGDYVVYSNNKGVASCGDGDRKFNNIGYRVAYVDNDYVYLISSGSSFCMATDRDGNTSNSNLNSFDLTEGAVKHIENVKNQVVQDYCDSKYVDGGTCNSNNIWPMTDYDFYKIVEQMSSINKCYQVSNNMDCGYNNNLIDNGGYYWILSNSSNSKLYYWDAFNRYIDNGNTDKAYGVRAVIKLDKSVYVTGGTGTKKKAYKIAI